MARATAEGRGIAALFCIGLLGACASDAARIAPQLAVDAADLGGGRAVYLQVRDDRRDRPAPGAPLFSLGPVIRQQLTAAYEAQDFRVLRRVTGDPCELTVDILALDHGAGEARAALRAVARKGRESYGRDYAATATAGNAAAGLEAALVSAMADLARDPALLQFLGAVCNPLPERAVEQAARD